MECRGCQNHSEHFKKLVSKGTLTHNHTSPTFHDPETEGF